MPSPDARQLAVVLSRKAEGDEAVLDRLLDDPDVPDEVLGFHAQQAVEKRLKAVLAARAIPFERTRSIAYLTSLLEHHGIVLPDGREQIEELTPWAAAARYEDNVDAVLNRHAARQRVTAVREWSEGFLSSDR